MFISIIFFLNFSNCVSNTLYLDSKSPINLTVALSNYFDSLFGIYFIPNGINILEKCYNCITSLESVLLNLEYINFIESIVNSNPTFFRPYVNSAQVKFPD